MTGVATSAYGYLFGDNDSQKFKHLIKDLQDKLDLPNTSETEKAQLRQRIADLKMQTKDAMLHDRKLNLAIETVKFASGHVFGPVGTAVSTYATDKIKTETSNRLKDTDVIQKARIAAGKRTGAVKSPKIKRKKSDEDRTLLQERTEAVSHVGVALLKRYAMELLKGSLITSLSCLSIYLYTNSR